MNLSANSIDVLAARATVAAATLKLLANEQRLLLLCRLTQGEAPVGDLVEHLGQSQSSVSQHLARLREGGLVTTRREGTIIHYRLADAGVSQLINSRCDRFGGEPG